MNTDGKKKKKNAVATEAFLGPLGPVIFVETRTNKIFKLQRSGICRD